MYQVKTFLNIEECNDWLKEMFEQFTLISATRAEDGSIFVVYHLSPESDPDSLIGQTA